MTDEVNVVLKGSVEGFDKINKQLAELRSLLESSGADMSEFNSRLDKMEKTATKGGRAASEAAKANRELGKSAKSAADGTKEAAAAADAGAESNKKLKNSTKDLISTRYALYDVANAYRATGAVMAGVGVYAAVVGARFESAFTNVQRTLQTDTTAEEMDAIRRSLVQLSGQIPLTFSELSEIATIGNQMGIAKEDVVDFTGTIARFSSVAGISIEETTKAFGGFMAQTGLAPRYLENLGASIAKVGIDSNATEAQILSLMREISAGASKAGFAADQIVGLSGTLASLQVAPERARGALTTYFGTLNRAVSKGGEDLQNFSVITGLTTDKLREMVDAGQGADVFERFLKGLADTGPTSKTTAALDALNLSQLRVSDTFTRLMGRMDLYARDQENANSAFLEGAELSRQYSMTMDDLASQWQIFINGINGLVDAISGGATPTLAALFQMINKIIFGLTEFLGSGVGKWIAGGLAFVAILTTVIGSMMLFRGMLLAGTAATLAMRTAVAQMGGSALAAAGTVRGLAGALFGVGAAGRAGAGGVITLKLALRALMASTGIGLLIALLGMGAEALVGMGSGADDASISLDEYNSQVKNATGAMDEAAGGADGLGDSLGGAGSAAEETAKKVRTLVDYVNDLNGVFRRSSDLRFGSQAAMDEVTLKWIALNEQAEQYQRSIRTLTADRKLKQYWLDIANLYDDQIRASQLREEIAKIDDDLAEAQAGASTELQGNSKAAIENRKKMRELLGGYEQYIEALAAAGMSQEQIQAVIKQLNGDFTAQASALGYSGAELGVYRQRFQDLATIVAQVPREVTVAFNGNPALLALNEFFAKAQENAKTAGAGIGSGLGGGISSGLGGLDYDSLFDPLETGTKESFNWWDAFWAGDPKVHKPIEDFFLSIGEGVRTFFTQTIPDWWNGAMGWIGGLIGGAAEGFLSFWPWLAGEFAKGPTTLAVQGNTSGIAFGTGVNNGTRTGLNSQNPMGNWANGLGQSAWSSGNTVGSNMAAGILNGLRGSLNSNGTVNLLNNVQAPAGIRKPGFSGGGYTGAGHWLQPAGIVHKGEYVVPKKHVDQRTGLPNPNYVASLQRGKAAPKMGYATGGHVSGNGFAGPMELGPATIGALLNGMSVRLNVGREQLASAASGGNKRLAFSGSN